MNTEELSLRLFVAIELPDEIKARLAQLRYDLPGARWVPPEQLHLTLAFVGSVAWQQCRQLHHALAGIQAPGFTLRFSGLGTFPDHRPPRVLWAGLAPEPLLYNLAARVRQAVLACDLPQEERPFAAHVTLARFRQPAWRETRAFLEQQREIGLPELYVRDFHLFQSELTPKGAIHTPIGSFPLVPHSP